MNLSIVSNGKIIIKTSNTNQQYMLDIKKQIPIYNYMISFQIKRILCLIVVFIFFIKQSKAEPSPQDFIFQNQQHQWENAEREKEIAKLEKDINEEEQIEQEKEAIPKPKEQCFDIGKIEVNGVSYFSKPDIENITKPNENQCLTVSDINQIAKQINHLYIENGYIGTHAFLPQQNIKTGLLKIEVKEGFIEDIVLQEEPYLFKSKRWDDAKIFFAMPIEFLMAKLGQKPALSLQKIEDSIYVFNKLQTNSAKIDLEPGNTIGGTALSIKNNPASHGILSLTKYAPLFSRTVITANIDNSGLQSVGEYRQNYNLSQDNLLGINDNLSLYYSGTLPSDGRKSDIINVNYSVPFGRWNFTVGNIYSTYSSFINGLNRNLNITGQTNITSFKIERLMLRGRGYRLSFFTKMNVWQINNYLEDAWLKVSSRNSTTFETGVSGMYVFLGNKSLYFNTSWVAGTNLFNATTTPNIGSVPNNQFNKIKGNLTINLPFKIHNESFGIVSTLGFQYGFNTMYSQEQISIGDRYTVRGFQNYFLISDSGAYIHNDFVYNLPNIKSQNAILKTLLTGMQIFVGYDWGFVQNYSSLNIISGQNQGQISGVAFGSRWRTQYTNFEIAFAKALTHPSQLMVDNFQVYFNLGLVF